MHGDMLRPVPKLGEKFGPRAGHPGLGVERADLVEKRGAAGGVEMGGDFIQQNEGAAPVSVFRPRALARTSEIRSAFCSPVEHWRAGASLST
jgi:hypothetical protein